MGLAQLQVDDFLDLELAVECGFLFDQGFKVGSSAVGMGHDLGFDVGQQTDGQLDRGLATSLGVADRAAAVFSMHIVTV